LHSFQLNQSIKVFCKIL